MTEKLPAFFKDPHILSGSSPDAPVLVALSGGADSSLLLHLMCRLRRSRSFPLYAAHVNHNIRIANGEAARDEEFCREICRSLGVELFVASIDVPRRAEMSKNSLETEAREARYAYFTEIMQKHGIPILATAHNADDNLETQIFNLCRGCGIEGMRGIPEARPIKGVEGGFAVRPILTATKSEITELCREWDIPFVTDSTNLETDYTRNAIRQNVLPELVRLFGTPQKSALRLSALAREDSDCLQKLAADAISDTGEIPLDRLTALPPSLASRAVRTAFSAVSDATLEAIHTDGVISLISRAEEHTSVSLPDKKRARIDGGMLVFENDEPECVPEPYKISLGEGDFFVGDYAIRICRDKGVNELANGDSLYSFYTGARLHADPNSLFAKSRAEGDAIVCRGMTKKLKKLMNEKKIPLRERVSIPIICDGEGVIYVPLCAVSDRALPTKDGDHYISIYKKQ